MLRSRKIGPAPYLLASLALFTSVAVALYLSYLQSERELKTMAENGARDVLERSTAVSEQYAFAIKLFDAGKGLAPCSASHVDLMRRIALGSRYLRGVGYVEGDLLLCSSFGLHGSGIDLGPAEYLSTRDAYIRSAVRLPIGGEERYLVATSRQNGMALIVLPSEALDIPWPVKGMSAGLFSSSTRKRMIYQGASDPTKQWREVQLDELGSALLVDHDHIVAFIKSDRFDQIAYAAIPRSAQTTNLVRYALVLVPLSLIGGIALVALILVLAERALSTAALLRRALSNSELFLLYQPVVNIQTGEWKGAEALLRWRQRDGAMIAPDVFIVAAERAGLIEQVTERVMELYARDTPEFFKRYPDAHIGLNFSSHDLLGRNASERLPAMIERGGISAGNVVLEITERALVDADAVRANLKALRASGVKVAIDDFGTGYSSLSHLTSLELDYLKIDKVFVDTIGTDAATAHVVNHIIEIARSMNLEMVAEGVETPEQANYLRSHGVKFAQGQYYSMPITMTELIRQMIMRKGLAGYLAPTQTARTGAQR